jgi:hypothetical protein
MPVSNVAADSDATSSWANSVADAVTELEADLYPVTYGQLAIPWTAITGEPATFPPTLGTSVVTGTAYGAAAAVGVSPNGAHEDHGHGTPALPTPAQVGSVASYTTPATIAGGRRLYVGTATPTGASEGDIWIKG